jgi:hypothetical protein
LKEKPATNLNALLSGFTGQDNDGPPMEGSKSNKGAPSSPPKKKKKAKNKVVKKHDRGGSPPLGQHLMGTSMNEYILKQGSS